MQDVEMGGSVGIAVIIHLRGGGGGVLWAHVATHQLCSGGIGWSIDAIRRSD